MKTFLSIVIIAFFISSSLSQSTFDKSLNEISDEMAIKLSEKNKKKIVVLYVTDINKSQTVAGKYMADVISVHIVNNPGNFEVFDRENLSGIVEAKKMIAEGYIDANQAKQLGKILAVDAIIIGNYTVLSSTLKLTMKALDVNSGFVIAAGMKDLPINADVGALLGINSGPASNDLNANRGFNNRPMNSNESYNNPETVNKKCETDNTGDYCFTNSTNFKLKILVHKKAFSTHAASYTPSDYLFNPLNAWTQK
ncbi:MAG TPA: CsgG/HfaB family protein [Saprospiraceae bacterium]|mgnify:CR=1 FL=1|nr:CsgG/HfaB family protein [Saprospiraceae bacterium]